jgi:hypothetical protein
MKNIQTYFFLFLILLSCGDATNKKDSKTQPVQISKESRFELLSTLKDSLGRMRMELVLNREQMDKGQMIALQTKISVAQNELINQNLSYFKTFPKDSLAPYCLMNIYSFYDEYQSHEKAISYIDTLELYYPKFEFLSDAIELKAATLDFDVQPRDTIRIRKAYEHLLSFPELPPHKKETYSHRISNLDKGLNDLIGN